MEPCDMLHSTLSLQKHISGSCKGQLNFHWCFSDPSVSHEESISCMRCGYEVPGMVLLQAYPCICSILRGVTFEALPLSSYALSPMILPLLETFLELLLWNSLSVPSSHFFGCHQYPEIFTPLRQALFLETARSRS
jgi:hypothetical protein